MWRRWVYDVMFVLIVLYDCGGGGSELSSVWGGDWLSKWMGILVEDWVSEWMSGCMTVSVG